MASSSADIMSRNTPWPSIPEDETVEPIQITCLQEIGALPQFDIRNGDASDAKSLLIKPTISEAYHWVPVAGVAPAHAMQCVEAYIKSHMLHLTEHRPANMSDTQLRKVAIVLGVARAVSTALYSITPIDLIPGELAASRLNATRGPNGAYTFRPKPGATEAQKQMATAPLNLTTLETTVTSQLVSSAIGLIPLQGYSLMMTGHHYISEASSQSRKAYAVVEKQFWKGQDYAQWFNDDITTIQDAIWHKACHPVNMTLKEIAATDPKVADMVKTAGAGSAAARLPALEPEVRAANSHMTLMKTVSPMFEICGGEADCSLYQVAIDTVKSFPVNVVNPARPLDLPEVVPAAVVNRFTAKAWLSDIISRNSDKVAYCFGFYCALSDQNQTIGGAGGTDTLKTSFSLVKLKTQSFASFVSGQQTFGDYQAARSALRAAGKFRAPSFKVE